MASSRGFWIIKAWWHSLRRPAVVDLWLAGDRAG